MGFYAYIYLRKSGSPYYVGKGSGRRAFKRKKNEFRAPENLSRIIVIPCEQEWIAFETEKSFIQQWGRKDLGTGCLHNRTDGGEGHSGRINKNRGKKRPQTSASLMGNKNNFGKKYSEESRTKMRVSNRNKTRFAGKRHSEETRIKMRLAHEGIPWSEARWAAQGSNHG